MQTINVYCIIVTYNAMRWIDSCLGSIDKSSIPLRTVVIDNCSKDNTISHIRGNYPDVILIQNSDNKGFGQANNQGIEYAYKHGATHFFLLNQDAYIYPDTIEKLLLIQGVDSLSVVSPIHLDGKGIHIDNNFYIDSILSNKSSLVEDFVLGKIQNKYEVEKVCAASWMLSRFTVENIGGFDPIFFHYGEDWNYLQRVLYHKGEVLIMPFSYIKHDRIFHGNMKAYDKYKYIKFLLVDSCNINNRKKCGSNHKTLLLLIKSVFMANFNDSKNILKAYWYVNRNRTAIRKSKECNRKLGSNWLNLNN